MKCIDCAIEVGMFTAINGRCRECHLTHVSGGKGASQARQEKREAFSKATEAVVVSTEAWCPDLIILRRLGIITAEIAFGFHMFKEVAADIKGTFGGRSGTTSRTLRAMREEAIKELRREACSLGANAVISVDFDYLDTGSTGRLLVMVASGTALIVKERDGYPDR